MAWITVGQETFHWEKGKAKRYRTETQAWRTFCDVCGTSLTYENDERPGEIDLITATLDTPDSFAPGKDVFPEERLSWVPLLNG